MTERLGSPRRSGIALWCAALTLLVCSQLVSAQQMRHLPLMAFVGQALDSGESTGYLSDPLVTAFREKLQQPTMDLRVAVTTVSRYKQPGCSKLRVEVTLANAHLPAGGEKLPRGIYMIMAICKDGQAPDGVPRNPKFLELLMPHMKNAMPLLGDYGEYVFPKGESKNKLYVPPPESLQQPPR
jgi:hypothetical protein